MKDGVEAAASEPTRQFRGRNDIRKLPLGEVAPLAVMSQRIAHNHIASPGVVQRGHEIRSDKAGASGYQQHDVPIPNMRLLEHDPEKWNPIFG
ncbi:hypothetical protein NWI01_00500 [Nitrobacter winogradskyi]|uniref:Uncharacterized protein n=1 Tax=Nitrobacter winogradskyi TaxID=913 RepID=A0A4Y3W6F7_NITWI|nr:hypothetical protein NWI01_00500 [Nitrobacter winogradskyi]